MRPGAPASALARRALVALVGMLLLVGHSLADGAIELGVPAPMAAQLRALPPAAPPPGATPVATPATGEAEAAGNDEASPKPPLVLLFVNTHDTHSARAIEQVAAHEARNKELYSRARFVVVLCRIDKADESPAPPMPPHWRLARDEDDSLYNAYKVIATPTVVVVGAQDSVVGSHAGYNAGLVRAVQRSLHVELTGEDAPAPVADDTPMELRMARHMAEREIWERALPYFLRAAEQGPLGPGDQLLMARALVETGKPGEALGVLDAMPGGTGEEEAAALRERIAALQRGEAGTAMPGTP